MSIQFDIIEPNDILLFSETSAKDRSSNSSNNEKREDILLNLLTLSDDYLLHPEFGVAWVNLKNKLIEALTPLCDQPFSHFALTKMAGMSNNYDFVVRYFMNNAIVHSVKLEFKFNNDNVNDLAQFLELYDKDCKDKFEMMPISYSEYYYDNYLDRYLELDPEITEEKPSKDVYVKKIADIKYSHPFFRNLYERKTENKQMKGLLVKESIKKYLETFAPQFNFDKVREKIISSQTNKVFLMWDFTNFHTESIADLSNIQISMIETSLHDMYFEVDVANYIHNIRVRLNWGNNNGVANPRWKLTFINK